MFKRRSNDIDKGVREKVFLIFNRVLFEIIQVQTDFHWQYAISISNYTKNSIKPLLLWTNVYIIFNSLIFWHRFHWIFCFTGDNESGKTTLIAKLQGNEDPKKGSGLEYAYIEVRDEYRDGKKFIIIFLSSLLINILFFRKNKAWCMDFGRRSSAFRTFRVCCEWQKFPAYLGSPYSFYDNSLGNYGSVTYLGIYITRSYR